MQINSGKNSSTPLGRFSGGWTPSTYCECKPKGNRWGCLYYTERHRIIERALTAWSELFFSESHLLESARLGGYWLASGLMNGRKGPRGPINWQNGRNVANLVMQIKTNTGNSILDAKRSGQTMSLGWTSFNFYVFVYFYIDSLELRFLVWKTAFVPWRLKYIFIWSQLFLNVKSRLLHLLR